MCPKTLGVWVGSRVLQIVGFFFWYFYIILNISILWEDILALTKTQHFLFANFPIDKGISQKFPFRKGQSEQIAMPLKSQMNYTCTFTEAGSVYFLMNIFLIKYLTNFKSTKNARIILSIYFSKRSSTLPSPSSLPTVIGKSLLAINKYLREFVQAYIKYIIKKKLGSYIFSTFPLTNPNS